MIILFFNLTSAVQDFLSFAWIGYIPETASGQCTSSKKRAEVLRYPNA